MSQPVKLSDGLILDARLASESTGRSLAGQVEFRARLGRSVDWLLNGRQVLELRQRDAMRSIPECLESVDTTAGRQRLTTYLEAEPFPHYEQHPTKSGLLIRIEADGRRRTPGRFVKRQFQTVIETPYAFGHPQSCQ